MIEFLRDHRSSRFEVLVLWAWISRGSLRISRKETPGADRLEFTFWKMNSMTYDIMDSMSSIDWKSEEGEKVRYRDQHAMKMFCLRYMFRSWSLEPEMGFQEDGGLDDSSMEKLLGLHPVILRELVSEMLKEDLQEEDEMEIVRQSHLLFRKGGSVSNPHRMISLYCRLSDMWDKFGLNYFDLQKMPLAERNALLKIISVEKQIESQESKINPKKLKKELR